MGDNPGSTNSASPRKLPIPNSGPGASANSALKGILIKPKRILPPQPDNQKLRRPVQESNPDGKSEEVADDGGASNSGFSNRSKTDGGGVNFNKVTVPKLNINVDRLKNYFQLQGSAVVRTDKRKTDLNENDIYTEEKGRKDKQEPLRSQGESSEINPPLLIKETSFYSSASKVKHWCSARDGNTSTTKMTSEPSVTKTLERRSPSPKSNATWDRSSSGYSSDERADPRSPPPSHSASVSVSSKTETEVTNEDDVSADVSVDKTNDVIKDKLIDDEGDEENSENADEDTLKFKDENNSEVNNSNNVLTNNTCIDDLLTSVNDCNVVTLTPTPAGVEAGNTGAPCENCDNVNNQSADNKDTSGTCLNFSFDTVRQTQNSRRPVWTAVSNPPGNGRIQYRKSGSESMISLRHSSRQGISDSNFDGLEVCGKSFQQQTTASTLKPENGLSSVQDGLKCENAGRPEILSSSSAFTPIERPVRIVDNGAEINGADSGTRARGLKPPLATCKSPRDFRSLGLPMNGKWIFIIDI